MTPRARTALATFAVSTLAAVGASPAGAAASSSQLGQHVASCAQQSLRDRANPPSITCTHDGMTMTFANFGDMVLHMRAMS